MAFLAQRQRLIVNIEQACRDGLHFTVPVALPGLRSTAGTAGNKTVRVCQTGAWKRSGQRWPINSVCRDCSRSFKGTVAYCSIRSYLGTLQKQSGDLIGIHGSPCRIHTDRGLSKHFVLASMGY